MSPCAIIQDEHLILLRLRAVMFFQPCAGSSHRCGLHNWKTMFLRVAKRSEIMAKWGQQIKSASEGKDCGGRAKFSERALGRIRFWLIDGWDQMSVSAQRRLPVPDFMIMMMMMSSHPVLSSVLVVSVSWESPSWHLPCKSSCHGLVMSASAASWG